MLKSQKRFNVYLYAIAFFLTISTIHLFYSNATKESANNASNSAYSKEPSMHLISDRNVFVVWETKPHISSSSFELNVPSSIATISKQSAIQYSEDNTTLYKVLISLYEQHEQHGQHNQILLKITNHQKQKHRKHRKHKTTIIPLKDRKKIRNITIIGDNQEGRSTFKKLLSLSKPGNTDLFLHLGDMVQRPGNYEEWNKLFFTPISSIIPSTIPILNVLGNHDCREGIPSLHFPSLKWFKEIRSASSGSRIDISTTKQSGRGSYHSMSIGLVRFVIIDTNNEDEDQIQFLKNEFGSASFKEAKFKVVLSHVPAFIEFWNPATWKTGGESRWPKWMNEKVLPMLLQAKVDLLLSGHQHNYQRGKLGDRLNMIISGGGGSPLDKRRVEEGTFEQTFFEHHFLKMFIEDDKLTIRMINSRGVERDSLVIQ